MSGLTRYAKFITALVGSVVAAASLGLLPEPYASWVPVIVFFATSLGVYTVPNTPPPGRPSDPNISERASKTMRTRGNTHPNV